MLIDKGANVNTLDNENNSALMFAATYGGNILVSIIIAYYLYFLLSKKFLSSPFKLTYFNYDKILNGDSLMSSKYIYAKLV